MKLLLSIVGCFLVFINDGTLAFVAEDANSSDNTYELNNDTDATQLMDDASAVLLYVENVVDVNAEHEKSVGTTSSTCLVNRRGSIRGLSNRCLDVPSGNSANGTPLQLHDCNNTPAQIFMTVGSDSTIRVFGKCIGLKSGSINSGTVVDIYDCTGALTQQWLTTSTGQIISMRADKCLHAVTSLNRAAIQIQNCDNSANQRWDLPE